jgi:hypothetical protein
MQNQSIQRLDDEGTHTKEMVRALDQTFEFKNDLDWKPKRDPDSSSKGLRDSKKKAINDAWGGFYKFQLGGVGMSSDNDPAQSNLSQGMKATRSVRLFRQGLRLNESENPIR